MSGWEMSSWEMSAHPQNFIKLGKNKDRYRFITRKTSLIGDLMSRSGQTAESAGEGEVWLWLHLVLVSV